MGRSSRRCTEPGRLRLPTDGGLASRYIHVVWFLEKYKKHSAPATMYLATCTRHCVPVDPHYQSNVPEVTTEVLSPLLVIQCNKGARSKSVFRMMPLPSLRTKQVQRKTSTHAHIHTHTCPHAPRDMHRHIPIVPSIVSRVYACLNLDDELGFLVHPHNIVASHGTHRAPPSPILLSIQLDAILVAAHLPSAC